MGEVLESKPASSLFHWCPNQPWRRRSILERHRGVAEATNICSQEKSTVIKNAKRKDGEALWGIKSQEGVNKVVNKKYTGILFPDKHGCEEEAERSSNK